VRPLLQGAHIVPDSEAAGVPTVQNGLSLCSIHHAAYDRSIVRIKSDYTIAVEQESIEAGDNFARISLSEFDGRRIFVPSDITQQPNPDFLDWRFRR
jgi:putative restriction endonuclease